MRALFKVLFLLMFSIGGAGLAIAADTGVLEAVGGAAAVKVKREGKTLLLKKGDSLAVGDELSTEGAQAVDIRFPDKSLVRVGANSVYKVEEDSSLKKLLHRLLTGIVRVIVPPSSEKKGDVRFRMSTPEGTIGVRGTEFVVIRGNDETTLKGLEGEVMFGPAGANFDQPDQFVLVARGFESRVKKGGKPSAAASFPREKYLREINGKSGLFGGMSARDLLMKARTANPGKEVPRLALGKAVTEPRVAKKEALKKLTVPEAGGSALSPGERLLIAAAAGNLKEAEAALKNKADVNFMGPKGLNPLHSAIVNEHFEMTNFLLEKGANPNALTGDGDSPLIVAVRVTRNTNIVSLLAQKGDATLRGQEGKTALELVQESLADARALKDANEISVYEALEAALPEAKK